MSRSPRQRAAWPPPKPLSQMSDAEYSAWFAVSSGHMPLSAGYSKTPIRRAEKPADLRRTRKRKA